MVVALPRLVSDRGLVVVEESRAAAYASRVRNAVAAFADVIGFAAAGTAAGTARVVRVTTSVTTPPGTAAVDFDCVLEDERPGDDAADETVCSTVHCFVLGERMSRDS